MKRVTVFAVLLSACCFIAVTVAAQGTPQNRHTAMRSVTQNVLAALAKCDTAALVNMLDTGYNHLGKPGARQYFNEDALLKCGQYKKLLTGFTMPPVDSLQLATDKLTHNTICILHMAGLPNGVLNVSKCALVVSFYPAKLFSAQAPGQCLGFYFNVTPVRRGTGSIYR